MAANPYELTTREVLSILFKEKRKLIGVFLVLFGLVEILDPADVVREP